MYTTDLHIHRQSSDAKGFSGSQSDVKAGSRMSQNIVGIPGRPKQNYTDLDARRRWRGRQRRM